MQRHGLDLTFDLGVVTLTYKILFGLYLGNRRVEEVFFFFISLFLFLYVHLNYSREHV